MAALAGSLAFSPVASAASKTNPPAYKVQGVKQSVGLRNNNPGNIRKGIKWNGAVGDDGAFVKFATPEDGIRALSLNLRAYQKKYKLDTIAGIINRWSPPKENPTSNYVNFVAKKMGKTPIDKINLSDRKTLTDLVTAIIEFENAGNPYPAEIIKKGIEKP